VLRADKLTQVGLEECDQPGDSSLRRWQWVFAILILAGMILIGVSVLLLLRGAAPVHGFEPCARVGVP